VAWKISPVVSLRKIWTGAIGLSVAEPRPNYIYNSGRSVESAAL